MLELRRCSTSHFPGRRSVRVVVSSQRPAGASVFEFAGSWNASDEEAGCTFAAIVNWVSATLDQHDAYYEVRVRALRLNRLPRRKRSVLMVAGGSRGFIQAWTFLPINRPRCLQRQRAGVLVDGE